MASGHRGVYFYGTGLGSNDGGISSDNAHLSFVCPWCGVHTNGAVLAAVINDDGSRLDVRWVRCSACGKGVVVHGNDDTTDVSPRTLAGRPVESLPSGISEMYEEARVALGFGAPTGCEMLCRSILGHIAHGLGWTGGNFVSAMDWIENEGFVTSKMKPWVDRIRVNGNEVVHEFVLVTEDRARQTLAIVEQLLIVVYQMPGIAAAAFGTAHDHAGTESA